LHGTYLAAKVRKESCSGLSRPRPQKACVRERWLYVVDLVSVKRQMNAVRTYITRGHCQIARKLALDIQAPLLHVAPVRILLHKRVPEVGGLAGLRKSS